MSASLLKKIVSVLMVALLTLSLMPGSLTAAYEPGVKLPASSPIENILASLLPAQALNALDMDKESRPVELIELRSETGKHFRLEDGRNVAIHFVERLHYLDQYGLWQDIDNTIIPVRNESYPYRNKANDYLFYFTDGSEGNGARWESGDYWLEMKLIGSQPAKAAINENTVYYPEVFPSVGLEYTVLNDALKESLFFHALPQEHEFRFHIQTQGLELVENGGIIEAYSLDTNELISALMSPFLIDSAEEMNYEVSQTLEPTDSGYILVYTIDNTDWLEHKDRVYPIKLDPSLSFSLEEDTYAEQRFPSTLTYNQEHVYVGYDDGDASGNGQWYKQRTRGFLRFYLPEVSPYADIQEAYVGMYRSTAWGGSSRTVNLHRVTSSVPMRQICWNNMPSIASLPWSSVTVSGWTRKTYQWDVTKLVKGWLNGTYPNYGVCIKFANEYQQGEAFAAKNHNNLTPPRHAPYLVMVYEMPPPPTVDITAPAGGSYARGTITLSAAAGHVSGIQKVQFDTPNQTLTDTASPYSVQWNSAGVADGSYTVSAIAYANTGQVATDSISIIVDNTAPALSVSSPAVNARVGGTINISGTASDARSGLAGVDIYVNGQKKTTLTSSPFSYAWDTRTVGDGTAEVKVIARDKAGNSNTKIIPVTIQNYCQGVSILTPSSGSIVSGQVQVEVSATGAVTLVELLVNGVLAGQVTRAPYCFNLDTTIRPDGEYVLTAQARGYAGNPVVSAPVRIIISNAPPSLEVLQPEQGAVLTGIADIAYTAESLIGIDRVEAEYENLATGMRGQLLADGAAEAEFSWDVSRLFDGPYQLTFRAYDLVGKVTTVKRNVTVENIPATTGLFSHHTYTSLTFAAHTVKVNLATGNLLLQAEDAQLAGGALRGVSLRTYNHQSGWLSLNGRGNNMNYAFLYAAGDGAVNLIDFSGAKVRFMPDGSGGYLSPPGIRGELSLQPGGTFRYRDSQEQLDYLFDTAGRLEEIRDLNGNSIAYSYDAQGRLFTIVNPSGQQILFRYNPAGLVRELVDNAGRTVTYEYDAQQRLTSVTDALNGAIQLGYDADGRLSSITDKAGETMTISYQDNRVSSLTSPVGDAYTFVYDLPARATTLTNPLGTVTKYSYDQFGRVTEKTELDGSADPYITSFVFDEEHNLTKATDPAGRGQTFVYDSRGNLISYTDAAGGTTSMEYNGLNQVTSIEDQADQITALGYDQKGNLTSLIDPAGGRYEFTYDDNGYLLQELDPLGRVREYVYDDAGNLIRCIEPTGALHDYVYDDMGNMLQYTDPAGQSTTFEYDLLNRATRITDTEGSTTRFSYNDTLREVTVTNPLGKSTSYRYNYLNQVVQMVDAAGNVTAYDYDGTGNMTQLYTAAGIQAKYGYDPLGRLAQYTNGEGYASGFTWDKAGNLVQTADPNGAVHSYGYDLLGRLTTVLDPLGGRYEYAYDPAGNLTAVTDPLGSTTSFKYNPLSQLTRLTTPQGENRHYEYDAGGRLTKITFAEGLVVDYLYDDLDRVIQESNSIGEARYYSYDASGNVLAASDELNQIWLYQYDSLGRVVSTTDPAGNTQSCVYDAAGRLTSQSASGQGTWFYDYDDLDRLLTATDPRGLTTSYQYDTYGNMSAVTAPSGAQTMYTYNALGQLKAVTDSLGNSYSYNYDPAGNLIYSQDPLGNGYTYRYNAMGWLIEVTNPMEGVTAIEYDAAGNPVRVIDPAGNAAEYAYDAFGSLIRETDPLGQAFSYLYDSHGRMEKQTEPRGMEVSYAFDEASRLLAKTTPEDTGNFSYPDQQLVIRENRGETVYTYNYIRSLTSKLHPLAGEMTFSYQNGSLISRQLGSFQTTYSFSETGLLNSIGTPGGDVNVIRDADRVVGSAYPSGWNSASLIGPTGLLDELTLTSYDQIVEQIIYQRDALGRIISEGSITLGDTAYEYDSLGRLVRTTYPDGRSEEYTYDQTGNLVQITSSGEIIAAFQYDSANQLLKADYPGSTPGTLTVSTDAKLKAVPVDRIIKTDDSSITQKPKDNKPGNSENAPGHDPAGPGNSENAPGHNKDESGHPNTPAQGQELTFVYDLAGNLTGMSSDRLAANYTYDSENHLISAPGNGNHVANYTYNALGLRDSKTTQRGTVHYLYDGNRLVAEVDADGAILAYYSHDLEGNLVSVTYGDVTYFYHYNHRGDTLYMTDQDGNIAASYTYDAWGNILSKEGDLANKNPYRFKGRYGYYFDTDTDLYLLGSRWYNPGIMRFMTRNTNRGEVADPFSLNRYAYCGSDPVNNVDPMGTDRETVGMNSGAGATSMPVVPKPPLPPQKPWVSLPKPLAAPASGTFLPLIQQAQIIAPRLSKISPHGIPSQEYGNWLELIEQSSLPLPAWTSPLGYVPGISRGQRTFSYEILCAGLGRRFPYSCPNRLEPAGFSLNHGEKYIKGTTLSFNRHKFSPAVIKMSRRKVPVWKLTDRKQ